MPTDPRTLPDDVKRKLLKIRDALADQDLAEAYHFLCSIADPEFDNILKGFKDPWDTLKPEDQTRE